MFKFKKICIGYIAEDPHIGCDHYCKGFCTFFKQDCDDIIGD